MIVLDEIKNEENIAHSTVVTYPRTVQISHGVYDNVVDMMNMTTLISQNITKEKELTNVYGGKTDWHFFDDKPEFLRFMDYIVLKHGNTNQFFNKENWFNKKIEIEVWGNELKKGDLVKMHTHTCMHLILYLTGGNPLVLPELKMKIIPKRGDYYIFPPNILHGVEEVLEENNKRYCLVANMHEKPDWKVNKIINDFNKDKLIK